MIPYRNEHISVLNIMILYNIIYNIRYIAMRDRNYVRLLGLSFVLRQ